MKSSLLLLGMLMIVEGSVAQTEKYDGVIYVAPKGSGWKKETANNFLSYTHVGAGKKWCQLLIFKRTAGKGSIEKDFESEWNDLTAKQLQIISGPKKELVKKPGESLSITASGKANFDGQKIIVLHKVISGYNNCVSIIGKTNGDIYLKDIQSFLNAAGLHNPDILQEASEDNKSATIVASESNDAFHFNSTKWDDGWVSAVEDNWVEVFKKNIRILVHYPDAKADAYNSILRDGLQNAWNILVAPRYTSLQNVSFKPIQSFESIAFAEADGIEKKSGKTVHIVLFKKHYSNGSGRYLEIITADKFSFETEFGAYHNDEFGWDKISAMQYRNKFAVASGDLSGKWSASDYASLSFYYVNTGGYAGATVTSISHEFVFRNNGTYESDQAGASGTVGNQQFSRQVYKGSFSANNWEMELTNRFQGAKEKYNCYFEAIKSGRILVMTDKNGSVYSLVKNR